MSGWRAVAKGQRRKVFVQSIYSPYEGGVGGFLRIRHPYT